MVSNRSRLGEKDLTVDKSRRNFLKMVGVFSGATIFSASFLSTIVDWVIQDKDSLNIKKRSNDPENPGKGEAWIREDLI